MKRFISCSTTMAFVLIFMLLSGCVQNSSNVTFGFDIDVDSKQVYIRYADGTTDHGTDNGYSQTVTVTTDSQKYIVGGFLYDGSVSWVPEYNYTFGGSSAVNVTLNTYSRPLTPAVHAVKINQQTHGSDTDFVDVTYAILDEALTPVNNRTEVFAKSDNTVFSNTDPKDNSIVKVQTVVGGFSSYTENGTVTFVLKPNPDLSLPPISLYSGPQALTGIVTYDGNGSTDGDIPVDNHIYQYGDSVSVLGNTGALSKTGYTFAGWNTLPDGTGTDYAEGDTFNAGSGTKKLYAKWQSANALLSNLAVDQGTLIQESPLNYSVGVPYPVTSLDISLTLGDPGQTLTAAGATYSSVTGNVYSYHVSNLLVGSNPIQVVVTSQNLMQTTYHLTVNREPAVSSNADLSALMLSSGNVTPAFDSGTTEYTSTVPNGVTTLTVTANTADSSATITVNGAIAVSGQASDAVNLNVGSNPVTLVVTALNGTTKTYTVTVTRSAPSSHRSSNGGSASSAPASSTDGTLTLPVGKSGEVSLEDAVKIVIPADASDKELQLAITEVSDSQKLITSKDVLASPVFEILKNFSENFSKEITLTFAFDPSRLTNGQKPSVFYYDETKQAWVEIGGEVTGNYISVNVNHFTKFAVFGIGQKPDSEAGTKQQPVSFSDISGHWAEASIKKAVSAGMVSGYPDGTFQPDRTVTRAEFAVMLLNALQLHGDGAPLTFTDKANIGAWAQKSVAQAVEAGIISGYEDGSFGPDREITRSEMAMMAAKALGESGLTETATGFADDKDIPAWAKGSVAAMKKLGFIEGKDGNQFAPGNKTTRAEAVTVLLKLTAQQGK